LASPEAALFDGAMTQSTSTLRAPSRLGERAIELSLGACAAVTVLTTVGILYVLASESWAFLQVVPAWRLFADTQWTPLFADKHYGIWPLVGGTFLTSAIAASVALPCGLLSAIYMSEYASQRTRNLLKPVLEVLAGIPTVVYGYFALTFITPILKSVLPQTQVFNAASASIVVGIMVLIVTRSIFGAQTAGVDELLGLVGVTRTPLTPEGKVFIRGEYWSARADQEIASGEPVEVTAVEGMSLRVRRAGSSSRADPEATGRAG